MLCCSRLLRVFLKHLNTVYYYYIVCVITKRLNQGFENALQNPENKKLCISSTVCKIQTS